MPHLLVRRVRGRLRLIAPAARRASRPMLNTPPRAVVGFYRPGRLIHQHAHIPNAAVRQPSPNCHALCMAGVQQSGSGIGPGGIQQFTWRNDPQPVP